jgi:hypothetical protein
VNLRKDHYRIDRVVRFGDDRLRLA